MVDRQLQTGFREAKKITKKFAKTFYLASLFLPKEKKDASYAVYAICRLSDEAVDEITFSNQKENLQKLELNISLAYTEKQIDQPLLLAFRKTIHTYKTPKKHFDELLKGMYMDLEIKHYPDFAALYEYCYKVAGVIGLIMLKIFGYKNSAAEDYAIKLGVAMQLTNILRDINEDFIRGRTYLPQDEMLKFNISEQQLSDSKIDDNFKDFLRLQINRSRQLYNQSFEGIKLIDNSICRFVVLCMKEVYSGILDEIEKNNYDVFTKRAHVNKLKKLKIIFKILTQKKYL